MRIVMLVPFIRSEAFILYTIAGGSYGSLSIGTCIINIFIIIIFYMQ